MATAVSVSSTGNPEIDGLLGGARWNGTITYSFPDSPSDYSASYYGNNEPNTSGFSSAPLAMQQAANYAVRLILSYTNVTIQFAGNNGADIAIAESPAANPTSYAYYPANVPAGGDIWFGNAYDYSQAQLGNYYFATALHELGHSFGLKHSQETGGIANVAVPAARDDSEYTVMSYRSYVGAPLTGYTAEAYGYAQTYMANDMLALQTLYGANFTTHSENTVYSWSVTTGQQFINGVAQLVPGTGAGASSNRIFETIWDGNGVDTYDFSNYLTALRVNLNPGASSTISATQIAYLGNGHYAAGNIFNAYLFNGDARSYIDNAIGGSGNDSITGNAIANALNGGAGNDTLTGGAGNDTLIGGSGTDTAVYSGNCANYLITYNAGTQSFTVADERGGSPDGTDTLTGVENFQFVDGAIASSAFLNPSTVIESFGSTGLAQVGGSYSLCSISSSFGLQLKYNGATFVVGQFGDYAPIGAEQTTAGYQVVWKSAGSGLYSIWNTDINGNYITGAGGFSGSDRTLVSLEPSFHQDLNGDGVIGFLTTVMESFGSTGLDQVGSSYSLNSIGSSFGLQLKYNGATAVVGQFGDYAPIGAEQTTAGYQVVWKSGVSGLYSIWNTDSTGNYITGAGGFSGSDSTLVSLEPSFHQDLNGDGVIGFLTTVMESFGSTGLDQVGSSYSFYSIGSSFGSQLKYNGATAIVGEFGDYAPIGAEQTTVGYQVVWKSAGSGLYSIWNTDSTGNYITGAGGFSGSDSTLVSLEPSFHQDLNGDGVIGFLTTVMESFGSTGLDQVGSSYSLYSISSSFASQLKYNGATAVVGQFGDYVPIGAEQTTVGYQVVWKSADSGLYSIWNTDSTGNYITGAGGFSGSDGTLVSLEPSFHQDLNGDGVIGFITTVMESFGSTGLDQVGSSYSLYSISSSFGPQLKYNGATVVVGQFGDYAPIGAEQTTAGYQVVWKSVGSGLYSIWNTDSNGNYIRGAGGFSGSDSTLVSLEPSFHQDLNSDGAIGGLPAPTITFQINNAASNLADSKPTNAAVAIGNDSFVFASNVDHVTIANDTLQTDMDLRSVLLADTGGLLADAHDDSHDKFILIDTARDVLDIQNMVSQQLHTYQSEFHLV